MILQIWKYTWYIAIVGDMIMETAPITSHMLNSAAVREDLSGSIFFQIITS